MNILNETCLSESLFKRHARLFPVRWPICQRTPVSFSISLVSFIAQYICPINNHEMAAEACKKLVGFCHERLIPLRSRMRVHILIPRARARTHVRAHIHGACTARFNRCCIVRYSNKGRKFGKRHRRRKGARISPYEGLLFFFLSLSFCGRPFFYLSRGQPRK